MNGPAVVAALNSMKAFFDTSTKCLDEEDSAFAPVPGQFTVAQQVAHTAQTVDWFLEGAFRPQGFDMNFPAHEAEVRKVKSLAEARAWWERSMKHAVKFLGSQSEAELAKKLPPGIMGGAPRHSVVSGLVDHTAHHRGALTVYARMLGKTPDMPYG
jgi:uncharacterized damage-inducible protein DinB